MKFEELLLALELWRNLDQDDHLVLSRHEVIEIIECLKKKL